MSVLQNQQLTRTLAELAQFGVVPKAAALLDTDIGSVEEELKRAILDEIPAFSASGNPEILPGLTAHIAQHTREVRRFFNGGVVGDFEYVGEHSRRRAAQKFPLEATLHAYRLGHKILSRWMRDAALASAHESAQVRKVVATVADFAIEFTDSISTIATSEYVSQTRLLAEAEGDRRTELLSVLLSGYDESDGRVARILRQSGFLEQRQSFCVAVAQPVDPAEMQNPARARRLAESLEQIVRDSPVRSLVGIRDNTVVAVFSSTRRLSGWTTPRSALAGRVRPKLLMLGNAVLIGVSTDAPSTSHIPRAHREATLALDFSSVSDRVVQYSDIPLRRMLLRIASEDLRPALPDWTGALLDADKKGRGSLSTTLQAYADSNMNVLQAARSISVHPNTIYSRTNKIEDITGLNALDYHDLTELLLAIDYRRPNS